MDLRTTFPRSVGEKAGGYVHLLRMIDKCRAVLAGTEGPYIYPCPMDRRLFEFTGLTPERFTEAVSSKSDSDVAEWFKQQAAPHTQAEIDAWNEMMGTRGPDTEDKKAYFKECRDAIDPTRTDITSWADLLDLEEQRVVPRRSGAAGQVKG